MKRNAMEIRLAEKQDYDDVYGIMKEVHDLHVAWRPDVYRDTDDVFPEECFQEQIEDETILVAETSGKVTGVLTFEISHRSSPVHCERKVLYINIVGVHAPMRGKGIGHALFDAARTIAERERCDSISLDVNAWNSSAYRFYESLGYREDFRRMSIRL